MFGYRLLSIWLFSIMVSGVTACQAEPKVLITTQDGRQVGFVVEIADTPSKRAMGLQYRRDLATGRGMLFLFPVESQQSFWMKNTPLPLDMLFINRERKIAGIVERTVPFSLDPRSVPAPSQYVLEINGGLSERHGIKAGDAVRFENVPRQNVSE